MTSRPPVPRQFQGPGYFTPPGVNAQNPVDVHNRTAPGDASPGQNGGVVPHLRNDAHVSTGSSGMTPKQVRAMQQFLNNHGFQVAQDGILGPLTKSAAAAFRANHKGADAWNKAHGIGVHPDVRPPHDPAVHNVPPARTTAAAGAGNGAGETTFDTLLAALLKGGGRVGSLLDPKSFGDAAAAPSEALAKALGLQMGQEPRDLAQHEADISNWYGLDPKAKSYQLSVLGRLGTARDRDVAAAGDAASSARTMAQALAGSIGGSANDGSGTVLAAGADAAGTAGALGEVSKQFADDMAPLLAAEAHGSQSRESAASQQRLLELQQKLAAANGQAESDRATAVAGATDKNNALGQQRFANLGNLLSTLGQMQAVDPTADLKGKKLSAEIAKLQAQTNAIKNPTTKPGSVPHLDLANAGNSVAGLLGVGTDHRLPDGVSVTKLAYTIGSQLQALGLKKGTPEYQRYGQQLISMFADPSGNPIVPPRSWFGPGS